MSILLALLLVSGQSGAAHQPNAMPVTAAPTEKKAEERKICRVQEAESGSHMSKRTCHTEREWDLIAQGVNLSDKAIKSSTPE